MRAYEKHPDDFWINEWLAVFQSPEALRYANAHAAVALRPDNAGVRLNLGSALKVLGRYDEAAVQYREAVRLSPDYAFAYNNLAWLLATVPDPQLRNPAEAVQFAVKAVELNPKSAMYHNTLGVAYYRAEKWQEAIASLQKSMELTNGGDAHDWFVLAMASWKTGEQEPARNWFRKAADWTQKKQPDNAELRRFWTEAADLLGESRPDQKSEGK